VLADYLNFKEYINTRVLNRARIIDDAYHSMMTDEFDYSVFLSITDHLSRKTNYMAC